MEDGGSASTSEIVAVVGRTTSGSKAFLILSLSFGRICCSSSLSAPNKPAGITMGGGETETAVLSVGVSIQGVLRFFSFLVEAATRMNSPSSVLPL